MSNIVTLLTDHLGSDKPKVMGIEYCVDVAVEIDDYAVAGEVITAASLGLSKITQAVICGYETVVAVPKILVDADATYTSESSITIQVLVTDGPAMQLGADLLGDLGMVRLRVGGTL